MTSCVSWLFALLGGACFAAAVDAQDPAVVQGQVVDGAGEPVAFANVQIAGTTDGAATGRDGRFRFATRHLERREIVASFIGYAPARQTLHLAPGDTASVRLVLRRVLIELGETAVTASTWSTGERRTSPSPPWTWSPPRAPPPTSSGPSRPSPAPPWSTTAPASSCAAAT